MRGFLQPAVRSIASETQSAFRAYTRGRRTKLAKLAQTTLVKADQWARGDGVPKDIADALENALKTLRAKKKK